MSFLRLKINKRWLPFITFIAGLCILIQWNFQNPMFPFHCLQDFVTGLSILLRGTVREKLEWTFHLYDINRDGYINREVMLCSHTVCLDISSSLTAVWSLFIFQEMTEIVRAIYDMMGKYTYPALKGDVPQQHVDAFFQVCLWSPKSKQPWPPFNSAKESKTEVLPQESCLQMLSLFCFIFRFCCNDSVSFSQKMDKNKDGVVTLEEFIIACQEVGGTNGNQTHCLFIISKLRHYITLKQPNQYYFNAKSTPGLTVHISLFVSAQDETMMRSMQLFENVM